MNFKLFFSTFVLIFLAELGDKTQLAAMARSASGGKVTVFLAASSALVVSTLVAVAFGSLLTEFVPERYIRIACGILFVVLGALILYRSLTPAPAEAPLEAAHMGPFSRFVLETATAFEEAAAADYRKLAADCLNPDLRKVLLLLARDEEAHLARLHAAHEEHGEKGVFKSEAAKEALPVQRVKHGVAETSRPLIEHAREHEAATARFYEELAKVTHLHAVRAVFRKLAAEEREHERLLREWEENNRST